MKTRKKLSFLVLIALLVSGFLLTSCPENTGDKPNGGEDLVRELRVTVQPKAIRMNLADWNKASDADRTFTVTLSEQKTATYQWYSRTDRTGTGTLIEGETKSTFTPTPKLAEEGSYNYYAVVKVDGKEIQSNNVLIKIIDMSGPAKTQFTIGGDRVHYVRGVGGTGSFMFRDGDNADASPDADVKYIDLLMGEIGCNILRIMVQDDYENYVENQVQSRNESIFRHDAKRNFFAVIQKVNALGGYVFANPWTAPAKYKTNNSVRGGSLTATAQNYVEYADYLRSFLKWLNTNNAPIFALGICNEPDYGDKVQYEGMGISSTVHMEWFKTVGHLTTRDNDIIPGFGGGKATHHVLVMTGDIMGNDNNINTYFNPTINDTTANNSVEIFGRHWYSNGAIRLNRVAGTGPTSNNPTGTLWKDRDQLGYTGAYETESLTKSPQMYAPGSTAGNIKREVWQTEHDFNYRNAPGTSTNIPGTNPQRTWSSAFAAMNDVDWAMRVVHESVFDWWYSSSFSGLVTSYMGAPVNGDGIESHRQSGAIEWEPYKITPRGRAFAHYARYVNETWSLPVKQEKGDINFNQTGVISTTFNAGAIDPKISAFEDVNGKFISIVMFAPNASTNTNNIDTATISGIITNAFGQGGIYGTNDPTRLSADVGRVEVVLPDGFTPTGASALRSYGWENSTGEDWDEVPAGSPRYWRNEEVFPKPTTDGKFTVEVILPGGHIVSIMVKGSWSGNRKFASPERVRPYKVD